MSFCIYYCINFQLHFTCYSSCYNYCFFLLIKKTENMQVLTAVFVNNGPVISTVKSQINGKTFIFYSFASHV